MAGLQTWDSILQSAECEGDIDEFTLWKDLGNQCVKQGDFERAQQAYSRAQALRPDSDVLMVNLGTLAIQQEELSIAVDHFRQAVRLNPLNDRAWLGLALVHRSFGDMDLAWANLEKALDINPDQEPGLWLAVDWAQRDGRLSWIIEKLSAHIQKWAYQSPFGLILVRLLMACGRLFQAQAHLQSLIDQRGGCVQAQELESELRSLLKAQNKRL